MTPQIVFVAGYAAFGAAAIIALVTDAFRVRLGSTMAGLMLLAGGLVFSYDAWTSSASLVFGSYVIGQGFSAVSGLVGLIGGLALVAPVDRSLKPITAQQAALVSLSAIGASIAAQSTDLVSLVISLEIAAAAGYALVASSRTRASAEASMKYLVQGAVITGMLVMGVGVALGVSGTIGSYGAVSTLASNGATPSPLLFASLLVVAAFVFKAGGAPFHSWAPDAYETAPSWSAAFLAGPVKLAMVCGLAIFVSVMTTPTPYNAEPLGAFGWVMLPLIGILAMLSIIIGSLTALRQRSYTRMLAYAGIAQVGYALIAVAAQAPQQAVFFTATYAIGTAGAFMAARAFKAESPDWDGSIAALAGVGRRNPVLGFAVGFLLLSLAGIPPLLGFWGKLQALQAAIAMAIGLKASAGYSELALWYAAMVIVGIAGAVVSLAYYGSVLRTMYSSAPEGHGTSETGSASLVPVIVLSSAVFVIGLLPFVFPLASLLRGFRLL